MDIIFFTRYLPGLVVFLLVSGFGLVLILRASRGENHFGPGNIRISKSLVYIMGALLQIPLLGYVYLGIQVGFF